MHNNSVRREIERLEKERLKPYAALSTDPLLTKRQHPLKPDEFRMEYHRDYTRIIHSRAFRRLRHKTQVFVHPQNDHVCTRLEHSLYVTSIAVTIARALGLNEDLVSAIAVGHDLGHTPFGHKGEESLKNISMKPQNSFVFSHELHSLRIVDRLESPYINESYFVGLNLTYAVRDGIACHYGEGFEQQLSPDRAKDPDSLSTMKRGQAFPATLEGCIVRWADKIAYVGRDFEDAIMLKIVEREDLPNDVKKVLGITNSEIIASLVRELSKNAAKNGELSVGDSVHNALKQLYDFSTNKIYDSVQAKASFAQIDLAMDMLYKFLEDLISCAVKSGDLGVIRKRDEKCLKEVLTDFLENDVRNWQSETSHRLAIDFIAGMTDPYFISSFQEIFLPKSTV